MITIGWPRRSEELIRRSTCGTIAQQQILGGAYYWEYKQIPICVYNVCATTFAFSWRYHVVSCVCLLRDSSYHMCLSVCVMMYLHYCGEIFPNTFDTNVPCHLIIEPLSSRNSNDLRPERFRRHGWFGHRSGILFKLLRHTIFWCTSCCTWWLTLFVCDTYVIGLHSNRSDRVNIMATKKINKPVRPHVYLTTHATNVTTAPATKTYEWVRRDGQSCHYTSGHHSVSTYCPYV